MPNSTLADQAAKPRDFPLFRHASGRWAKKVRGNLAYFGRWDQDPKGVEALKLLAEQIVELKAGLTQRQIKERKAAADPNREPDGYTVADVVNSFLEAKEKLVLAGERAARTLNDYLIVGQRMTKVLGRNTLVDTMTPTDFARLRAAFATTHGPTALLGDITRTRTILKWGYKHKMLSRPADFADDFNRPEARQMRLVKAKRGKLMFEREQVLAMLNGRTVKRKKIEGATLPLRAMILLAVNGGLGNSDVANMRLSNIDVKKGWLSYPRAKTGIDRRIPLWPETLQALKKWIPMRPSARTPENADLVFLTARGSSWDKTKDDNPISKEIAKLLKRLEIHRAGLNFYSLRRTFRTIASNVRDEPAANAVMGHAPRSDDMAATYTQEISDERLQCITNYVRAWLYTAKKPR